MNGAGGEIGRLRAIIARLRAPGGCPWDREQTPESLVPSLLEEAYETADAVVREEAGEIREELGDLLINILMQAEIASERGTFDLDSVASAASDKLVRRHPHVFASADAPTSEAVLTQWEEIKRAERSAKGKGKEKEGSAAPSLLDGVTLGLPALVRAHKIQKKAAKAGFDWESPRDVIAKVREELSEVEDEMEVVPEDARQERLAEEIGDLLFAVVNLARALGIDSESSLRAATGKFISRFRAMESYLPEGVAFEKLSLNEMNRLWEKAKEAKKTKS